MKGSTKNETWTAEHLCDHYDLLDPSEMINDYFTPFAFSFSHLFRLSSLYTSVCVCLRFFFPSFFHSFLPFYHRHRIILLLCHGWFFLSFRLLIRIDVENMDFKHVSIAQSFLYQMYVYMHKVCCESEQNLFHSKSTCTCTHLSLSPLFFLANNSFHLTCLFFHFFRIALSISHPHSCYTSWHKLVSQTMIAHHLPFLQSYWVQFISVSYFTSITNSIVSIFSGSSLFVCSFPPWFAFIQLPTENIKLMRTFFL